MAGVSVEKSAVQGGIKCCSGSIRNLKSASGALRRRYQQAGAAGWNDAKYTALGAIIEDCCRALERPVSELQKCLEQLNSLLRAVEEYEQTSLGGVSGGGAGSSAGGGSGSGGTAVSGNVSSMTSNSAQVTDCAPGEYHYEAGSENSRHAYGQLRLVSRDEVHRNQSAQTSAGGDLRREDDDGGHLIAARFGGAATSENLFPQNRNLNRSAYRALESEWARLLEAHNQVFVSIYTSASSDSMREDAIYGTYTVVTPGGQVHTHGFSFANESAETQEGWDAELAELSE